MQFSQKNYVEASLTVNKVYRENYLEVLEVVVFSIFNLAQMVS